ncbi:hypothetical protein TcWFU_006890 [Taenia crassiceps]|uniref:Uncharacterized protein n=1 Tax=Taenia crassiceps TaxID=6207 RepID=A0ABR4QS63_9CEST
MLLLLLAFACVWGSVELGESRELSRPEVQLELNSSSSLSSESSGLTEKSPPKDVGENEAVLNWSNSQSKFRPSDEKRGEFQLNQDDEPKARARMTGIALELERRFYPLYSDNGTHSFSADRKEETGTEVNRPDSHESIETRRMLISSLNPSSKKDNKGQKSVYDMLLIDENGNEDDESQKERELKRLEEIQEQRRIRMEHDSGKHSTRYIGEYVYLLPIEWMLDRGGVPYPPGYYPINLYDLIIDNDPSLNLSLVPQPANLRAALIPLAFTSMDGVSLVLLMVGWFLFLLFTAALIGIRAETHEATKCALNISKNLIYQREIERDPGLPDRLKRQAEEAGITPNAWYYLVLRKKDIGDDVFNRIALSIQHYHSYYSLIKRWEVLKNSDVCDGIVNPAIVPSTLLISLVL